MIHRNSCRLLSSEHCNRDRSSLWNAPFLAILYRASPGNWTERKSLHLSGINPYISTKMTTTVSIIVNFMTNQYINNKNNVGNESIRNIRYAGSKSDITWPVPMKWFPTWTSATCKLTTAVCTSAWHRPKLALPNTRLVSTSTDCPSSDPWTKLLSSPEKWCTSLVPSPDTPSNLFNGKKVYINLIRIIYQVFHLKKSLIIAINNLQFTSLILK